MPEEITPPASKVASSHQQFALSYLCSSWFPPNPESISAVQATLQKPALQDNCIDILPLLKRDVSLYSFCIKEVCETRATEIGNSAPDKINDDELYPIELLKQSTRGQLSKILHRAAALAGKQDYQHLDPQRGKRLIQPLISATVAETIAPHYSTDPETAYACALFRQIGLTLVAWNYPHVYSRAVATAQPGTSLDRNLSRVLGFSPTMLGASIARELQFNHQLRIGIGESPDKFLSDPAAVEAGQRLTKLCEIGETFARASDPDYYPKASGSWQAAGSELVSILGDKGFRKLIERIEDNCQAYLKLFPSGFKKPEMPTSPSTEASKKRATPELRVNTYIKHCPAHVSVRLNALYDQMKRHIPTRELIEDLTKNIIPNAGFHAGCIFLLEPETVSLMPRMAIGNTTLSRFNPVNYRSNTSVFDPIVAAYRSRTPIMEDKHNSNGQEVAYVAGSLGENQLAGVLYLEVDPKILGNPTTNPLVYFRAIRQALEDCLELY